MSKSSEKKLKKLTITTTAWTIYTNANLFFDKKKNRELANILPSLHFYGLASDSKSPDPYYLWSENKTR